MDFLSFAASVSGWENHPSLTLAATELISPKPNRRRQGSSTGTGSFARHDDWTVEEHAAPPPSHGRHLLTITLRHKKARALSRGLESNVELRPCA
ncbi:MAG: hypothetical protein CK538_05465 [Opitutia bacterium]|nr:MAG: hypothetical protein CK538_05465 [Opitutae bacterium]